MNLALLAALSVPAVPAMIDPGPVTCSTPLADLATVVDQRSAPPGGVWWLRQADFPGTRLAGELHLIDALQNELVAAGVRRTVESVSLQVPGGAAPGETFTLVEDGAPLGVALTVTDAASITATLDAAALGPTAFDECFEAFCSSTGEVPRVQTVDVTYQGGPAVLDAVALAPEELFTDLAPRATDSMLLPAVDAPTTVRVLAGPARSMAVAVDVHVRLSSLVDRSLLGEQTLMVAALADPPDGTPPEPCTDVGFRGGGDCVARPFGCGADCPPTVALLLGPLALRRLRRLRR